DEIELAFFRLADVVDVDDVRVVDAVRGARLAQHPRAQVRFTAQIRADELECDDAIDEHVAGAIHDAHAASPEARLEAIPPSHDATDHRIGRLRCHGRARSSLVHHRTYGWYRSPI